MIRIDSHELELLHPRITVVGVGGAGGNAVDRMIAGGAAGIDFVVANTDAQALNQSPARQRLQLGRDVTEGLGAGSHAEIGRAAAEESLPDINLALEGAHMCFIAAGMGGGTGTGAAPVSARGARAKGILTVAVVTTPFAFEGSRRGRHAEAGISELQQHVDTLIVIPNQNLFRIAGPQTTFREAFEIADDVLQQGVRGITDLMVMPGLVNLDFADVRSIMAAMGKAMMGSGEASGENRAIEAAERAIANPLLDGAIAGARGLIISITGGDDMRLVEVDAAASHIQQLVDPEANIIWGSAINPAFAGRLRVSIVATGMDLDANAGVAPSARAENPFRSAPTRPVRVPTAPPRQPEAPPPPTCSADPVRTSVAGRTVEADSRPARLAPAQPLAAAAPVAPAWLVPSASADAGFVDPGAPLHDLFEPAAASPHRSPPPPIAASPVMPALVMPAPIMPPPVMTLRPTAETGARPTGASLFQRMTRLVHGAIAPLHEAPAADPASSGREAGQKRRPPPRVVDVRRSNGIAEPQTYPVWERTAR
ncbi:MAG: ftsZ [Alphaproteobacteria bacterium]|nr:ftsZ [Alphaproteobacteria bacterium]